MSSYYSSRRYPAETPDSPVWEVGALSKAISDLVSTRFGYVRVKGELSGFSMASSGHCYFKLKDASGQMGCAMFRRAASTLNWRPRDGDLVEVQARVGVYAERGELQLVVETMQRAGQGRLYEEFLRLKAELERQGLFNPERKRAPTPYPRGIGVVTSLNTAALRDVMTALARRVPHVPVLVSPALVQGVQAPQELITALQRLYALARQPDSSIDTILLVRGGGSLEDLWAFNHAELAHTIVQSPVPLISGVGHETDFTIADFCADVRAATPTAAAELAAMQRTDAWYEAAGRMQALQQRVYQGLDTQAQRLDRCELRLRHGLQGLQRQSMRLQQLQARLQQALSRQLLQGGQRARLQSVQHRLQQALQRGVQQAHTMHAQQQQRLEVALRQQCHSARHQLQVLQRSLELLGPLAPLQRGYTLLQNADGHVLRQCSDFQPGETVQAQVADGRVPLKVLAQ